MKYGYLVVMVAFALVLFFVFVLLLVNEIWLSCSYGSLCLGFSFSYQIILLVGSHVDWGKGVGLSLYLFKKFTT